MPEIIAHIIQPIDWVQIIMSCSSILISLIAIIISINTYKSQVRHNKNSVKPILNIVCGDYENNIYVRIDNNGVGPALIKSISCSTERRTECSLFELIPTEVRVTSSYFDGFVPLFPLTDFVEDIAGRTIAPAGNIILLQLVEPEEKQRFALRNVLQQITVYVEYTDIYGEEDMHAKRELNFFGRTLVNARAKVTY